MAGTSQNPARPLPGGARLGPYELVSAIGAGGMGEVWKARDSRLDRAVAIKISREHFPERFEREARAVAALNHPHICQLYDVGPNYLVMELVEGAPLKGPLRLERAVEYAGQILEALDAAHRKGIVHRDLKPGNILVTQQGIKLLDFGLAKQSGPLQETDATMTSGLTQRGEIVGTLQYMAPEQLQGKEADARSDLFSFWCVLYEMLTGKRAFEGESAAQVIAAILEHEPAPLTGAARAVERVVRRALAKDSDQRFQTARDLQAALAWAMEQGPPREAIRPVRRWWWLAAAALVIGALGEWGVTHFRQPAPREDRAFRLEITPPEGSQFVSSVRASGIAISPDGRTVVFAASGGGKSGLWVRPLDGVRARLIPGTEDAAYPFWSPENKSIAFFTLSQLKRVDLAGGAPLATCDVASGFGGTWSGDGRILFAKSLSGLWQVSASGGTPSPVTRLDAAGGDVSHGWPQALPDGRFLFWIRSAKAENSGVYAASLAKPGERVRLLSSEVNALYAAGADGKSYLLWTRDATLVAQEFNLGTLKLSGEVHAVADPVAKQGYLGQANVAVSATGVILYSASNATSQFTWMDRAGKPLGEVGGPGDYRGLRLSPEGRRVAAERWNQSGRADLWLLEVERHVTTRLTSNGSYNILPVWSPDGRTIAFTSGSPPNLFWKDASGAGSEQRLTRSPNDQFIDDWSRDGRWILYHELAPGTGRDLWVLPVTPEGKTAPDSTPRSYVQTPFQEGWGRFSPEAPPHWVAYLSDETGRYEVYIQAFPEPHGKVPISTGGGRYPQWGAGGRELFYVSPDNKLMVVSLKLGADSVEPSAPRELFPLPVIENGFSPYEAAPDGQRFLVRATTGQAGQPLNMIVNWPALLKKPSAAP